MAKTVFLGNRRILAHWKNTSGSNQTALADNQSTIVQRGVLEEYVFYQSGGYLCIQLLAGFYLVAQITLAGYNNQSTGLGGGQVAAGLDNL